MKKTVVTFCVVVLVIGATFLTGCTGGFINRNSSDSFQSLVSGPSMMPTVHNGATITVRRNQTPTHNDLVVHRLFDNGEYMYLLKRVIAIGGDTITFVSAGNDHHYIYLNGTRLIEDFLGATTYAVPLVSMPFIISRGFTITIPHGSIFVIGDNRPISLDSRSYGYICTCLVLGVVTNIRN